MKISCEYFLEAVINVFCISVLGISNGFSYFINAIYQQFVLVTGMALSSTKSTRISDFIHVDFSRPWRQKG